jgi:AsmA protein
MSVKIAAQRKAEDAKTALNGEIGFEKVGVRMEKMAPVFSGTLVLTPEQITLKSMKLLAGKSSADIRGGIANYSANPDIHLDVASDMLDLDSIMPPAVKGGAASAPAVAATGAEGEKAKESGTPKKKVTAEGSVSVSRLLFRGVTMRNLKAEYTFRDNVFSLSPLTGETLSGSFSLRSAVDLSKKDPSFRLNATAAGIKLEDIAAAFAPKAKGILFGSLSARTDIGGTGSSAEAVKHSMKGKGLFSVKDGRIRNAPVSDGLLAVLGLQSLKEIPVEKGQGTFSISRGVIDLKSIIASKDLVIDESGTIGMDQTLNMSVLVKVSDRLSPKLLAQSGISKFLSEEKGWTAVPLRLTGSVTRPSYGVDTSAIGRRATKAIQKRVGDEIFKALSGEKKKEQQPSTTEKKGTSPEDLIKGLFK